MNSADHQTFASSRNRSPANSLPVLAAWLPWILAATLVVLCIWLSQLYFIATAENALLRDQQRLAQLELRSAQQHAEAERILAQQELAELRKQLPSR